MCDEMNVCRLCSSTVRTLDVFNSEYGDIRLYILMATGIEIKKTDLVSKVICYRCYEITLKLHTYRRNAVANDKFLKEKQGQPYQPPVGHELMSAIESASSSSYASSVYLSSYLQHTREAKGNRSINSTNSSSGWSLTRYRHRSILMLYRKYKDIILPQEIMRCNVNPVIRLNKNEVAKWYADRNNTRLSSLTLRPKTPCGPGLSWKNSNFNKENVVISGGNRTVEERKTNTKVSQNNHQRLPPGPRSKKRIPPRRRRSSADDEPEVLPQKKRRFTETTANVATKVNLTEHPPQSVEESKAIFTSSLELQPAKPSSHEPDGKHVWSAEGSRQVFMCSFCEQLCSSGKELYRHRRSHLKCKFCKKWFKSWEAFTKHREQTCFINIIHHPPDLQLTPVDEDPVLKQKYKSAFVETTTADADQDELPSKETTENLRLENDFTVTITTFNNPASTSGGSVTVHPDDNDGKQPMISAPTSIDAVEPYNDPNREVICISDDDSDLEIEEISQQVPPTESSKLPISNLNATASKASSTQHNNSFMKTFYMDISEAEVIRSLRKKYMESKKNDASVQTFEPLNTNIKPMDSNGIIVQKMFNEVVFNRVPVSLESHPTISAKFKEIAMEPPAVFEDWSHKVAYRIQHPRRPLVLVHYNPSQPGTSSFPVSCVPLSGVSPSQSSCPTPSPTPLAVAQVPKSNEAAVPVSKMNGIPLVFTGACVRGAKDTSRNCPNMLKTSNVSTSSNVVTSTTAVVAAAASSAAVKTPVSHYKLAPVSQSSNVVTQNIISSNTVPKEIKISHTFVQRSRNIIYNLLNTQKAKSSSQQEQSNNN